MSGHTSGPWQVMPEEVHRDYVRIRAVVCGCRYKIANVLTPVYPGSLDTEAVETRANARLVAAAPDLLEACELAARHHQGMRSEVGSTLRAAIAKAKGRS